MSNRLNGAHRSTVQLALPSPETVSTAAKSDPGSATRRDWKDYLVIGATTTAATAAGVYGGAEIAVHQIGAIAAEAARGLPDVARAGVALYHSMAGVFTHLLPWMVGMGAGGGLVGMAAGYAATGDKPGRVGAPLVPSDHHETKRSS